MTERRRVLVTGGTGALGESVTRRFLEEGDEVVVSWIAPDEADATRAALEQLPGLVLVRADLTNPHDVAALMQQARPFDVLVHLVGMWRGGTPLHETDDKSWDVVLDVNLRTAFNTARAVLPAMLAGGSGRLVFVSSQTARRGQAQQVPYAVSKAAVAAFTQALADETRGTGITCNAVVPSVIDTPANRRTFPDSDHSLWVSPADLAATISFLASDEAGSITGSLVPVPGGVAP